MSAEIDQGGYAFPGQSCFVNERGMSMRDWFASMALQAIYASTEIRDAIITQTKNDVDDIPLLFLSVLAYRQADAMLKVREVKE